MYFYAHDCIFAFCRHFYKIQLRILNNVISILAFPFSILSSHPDRYPNLHRNCQRSPKQLFEPLQLKWVFQTGGIFPFVIHRYLVQQSGSSVQEVEVVTCSKNGKSTCRTEEFDDSPSDSGTTTCKQIFSTRKLLAIDEDGVISVDSFQLPSACLCRYLTVRFLLHKLI